MPNVAKVKVEYSLSEAIKKAVDLSKYVEAGDVVLLKPNFNTADPFPASSDFEFLKAVTELVYEAGAKLVIVADSSMYSRNTKKVMEELGIFDLEKLEHPAKVYSLDEREWVKKEVPGGKYLKHVSVPEILDNVDKLILLPCMKTHFKAQFTGALKLSVGFMRPRERVALHLSHLEDKVAELNTVINPDLIIMDGRKCFITKGPAHGEVREPGLILVSENRVDIDIEGIKVIQEYEGNSLAGVDPEELPQIKRARELGIK